MFRLNPNAKPFVPKYPLGIKCFTGDFVPYFTFDPREICGISALNPAFDEIVVYNNPPSPIGTRCVYTKV